MVKNIFITGCARSGTTLLNRLFYAFQDVEIITNEIELEQFANLIGSKKYLVGKRHPVSVFSVPLKEDLFNKQLSIVKKQSILIVNIIRDGRDVVHKDINGSPDVKPDRWIGCMIHTIQYREIISINVKYEELVTNPDEVQRKISKALGLTIIHKFSSYPDFVPDRVIKEWELAHLKNYSKRNIETKSIGHNLFKYKERCRSTSELCEFEKMLNLYLKF